MTTAICTPPPEPRRPNILRNWLSPVVRGLLIAAFVAAFIVVLFLSTGKIRFTAVGREAIAALVYSSFISLPSIYLLTRISELYTGRFPRLIHLIRASVQICTAIAGCFAAGFFFQLVHIFPPSSFWAEFWSSAPFAVVISLIFGLSLSSYETLRYKYQAAALEAQVSQVEQERAYKLLAEARLSSLESRIHPHFLFNTLNSIAALIPSNPERAEDTIAKLASLLRFSLNAHHSGLVPLSQELKIVRDYLEIEKTRFGQRIRYDIAVPDSLGSAKVPPLALQSLVENAVKHVVAHRTEGATIQITGAVAGQNDSNRILLEVLDDGPGFSLDAITPDHGLGNLIARIELLYGNAGQLAVTRKGDKTAVSLTIPA